LEHIGAIGYMYMLLHSIFSYDNFPLTKQIVTIANSRTPTEEQLIIIRYLN